MKAIFILMLACLAGCSSLESDFCDAQDVSYQVLVHNLQGQPIPDLTTYTIERSSGDTLRVSEAYRPSPFAPGRYTILGDFYRRTVGRLPRAYVFVATDGAAEVRQEYLFASGDCHVQQLSGPDSLLFR